MGESLSHVIALCHFLYCKAELFLVLLHLFPVYTFFA